MTDNMEILDYTYDDEKQEVTVNLTVKIPVVFPLDGHVQEPLILDNNT